MNLIDTISEHYRTVVAPLCNPLLEKAQALDCAQLGAYGETWEALQHIRKYQYQGREFDRSSFIEELGDALWYTIYWLFLERDGVVSIQSMNASIFYKSTSVFGITRDALTRNPYDIFALLYWLTFKVDSSIDEVLAINKLKLAKRHPNGYTHEKARRWPPKAPA